jgi:hypothetical protein
MKFNTSNRFPESDAVYVAGWSFLTNHARMLLCIAHDPAPRLRGVDGSGVAGDEAPP